MDFSSVKEIVIPEGNVKEIKKDGVTLWKKKGTPAGFLQVPNDYSDFVDTRFHDHYYFNLSPIDYGKLFFTKLTNGSIIFISPSTTPITFGINYPYPDGTRGYSGLGTWDIRDKGSSSQWSSSVYFFADVPPVYNTREEAESAFFNNI